MCRKTEDLVITKTRIFRAIHNSGAMGDRAIPNSGIMGDQAILNSGAMGIHPDTPKNTKHIETHTHIHTHPGHWIAIPHLGAGDNVKLYVLMIFIFLQFSNFAWPPGGPGGI